MPSEKRVPYLEYMHRFKSSKGWFEQSTTMSTTNKYNQDERLLLTFTVVTSLHSHLGITNYLMHERRYSSNNTNQHTT
jgi:hypothetical protein